MASPATANSKHLRRPPAHLSVSLHHGGSGAKRTRQTSEHSEDGKHVGLPNAAQQWFDESNKYPQAVALEANGTESPYFLHQQSSHSSTEALDDQHDHYACQRPEMLATSGSADDFRGIIDDLTMENKRLKKRLRLFEKSSSTQLDRNTAFEVKIHALPTYKRRELETILSAFASSLGNSTTDTNQAQASATQSLSMPYPTYLDYKQNKSSSASNSRMLDSGYGSTSSSGPNSGSTSNREVPEIEVPPSTHDGSERPAHTVPSFSQHLFSMQSLESIEGQKKKIVVQRLEQLFTGKQGSVFAVVNQPLQGLRTSKIAGQRDNAVDSPVVESEGNREAYMLSTQMQVPQNVHGKSFQEFGSETHSSSRNSESPDNSSITHRPTNQRPTRPLELDPDRAQIPADNVEYIRHLGISAPQFGPLDSADLTADADGWVYLNLLINMAQLHIINVTTDFVRAAVSEVSQKFQISSDGQRLRWRGGHEGTQLSKIDNGLGSAIDPEGNSSNQNLHSNKRRRLQSGRSSVVLCRDQWSGLPTTRVGSSTTNSFHYTPIFHRNSSSGNTSQDEYESSSSPEQKHEESYLRASASPHDIDRLSQDQYRQVGAPIVFYGGVNFYKDLAGDPKGLVAPVHATKPGQDDQESHSRYALGARQHPAALLLPATDYRSSCPNYIEDSRGSDSPSKWTKTPELMAGETRQDSVAFDLSMQDSAPQPIRELQIFEASGLGGTQPADHFNLSVETLRPVSTSNHASNKVSRYSSPGINSRRIQHRILPSSLKAFHEERQATARDVTAHTRTLKDIPSSSISLISTKSTDRPIKSRILSTKFSQLSPSRLPLPMCYMAGSSSDPSSDSDTQSALNSTSD